jgi:hypothetical protein
VPLFLSEETKLRIVEKDRHIQNGIFNLTWNKMLSQKEDQFEVTASDSSIQAVAFPDEKMLKIYFTNLKSDTGSLQFFIKHNGEIIDSVDTGIKKSNTPLLFFDTIQHLNMKTLQSNPLVLTSNYISNFNIDTNRIYIIDTSENRVPFSIHVNEDLKTYEVKGNFTPQFYTIIISDSCFQDLAGNFNKSQEISFLTEEDKKGGNLLINIELDTIFPSLIFLFKDNQDKVLRREILSDSLTFQFNFGLMYSGNYKIEIIKDDNQNEIWNSGNFSKKTLPEKIYRHPTPVLVKENWDAEETIKPDFDQTKKAARENTLPQNESERTNNFLNNIKNNAPNNLPNNMPPMDNNMNRRMGGR